MVDATAEAASDLSGDAGRDALIEEFAGPDAAYFTDKFRALARREAGLFDLNTKAMLHGPFWGALRGNWLVFWACLAFDVVGLLLIARGIAQPVEGVGPLTVLAGVVVLAIGRLIVGASADRLYRAQFFRWRVDRSVAHGHDRGRLQKGILAMALTAPLVIYKATQDALTWRECRRLWRREEGGGEPVAFVDNFNCYVIGDLPVDRRVLHDPIAGGVDGLIEWLVINFEWLFDAITWGVRELLQALELVFVGTPWAVMAGLLVLAAWRAAGRSVAIFVAISLGYLAVLGYWEKAMSTFSLVGAATVICVVLGVPIGIWCAKNARAFAIIRPVLDIMQTLPSFVYLIPAIAFFSVGKPPAILATVIFALPPMVRLTTLGIIQVPNSVKEAATAFGATPRQLLWKVELPLAVPSIMTGINQTIMMSLSMVVIAALIAAKGLGEDVLFALQHVEHGKGLLAGGAIALVAMMMDRVVQGMRTGPK